jgi:putative DNA primase/helicase
MDSFSRAEATRVKAFVSSPEDRYRPPYDFKNRTWPRQCVFVGTTNLSEYFKDPTGATRFWPLVVKDIQLDALANARDQLFAEAVAKFKAGMRWYPTPDETERLFRPQQDDREIPDPWHAMIERFLIGKKTTTLEEILSDGLKIDAARIDGGRQMATRVGIAMKRLGWIKRRKVSGSRSYFYEAPSPEVMRDDEKA